MCCYTGGWLGISGASGPRGARPFYFQSCSAWCWWGASILCACKWESTKYYNALQLHQPLSFYFPTNWCSLTSNVIDNQCKVEQCNKKLHATHLVWQTVFKYSSGVINHMMYAFKTKCLRSSQKVKDKEQLGSFSDVRHTGRDASSPSLEGNSCPLCKMHNSSWYFT